MGSFAVAQDVIDLIGGETAARMTTDAGTVPDSAMIDGYINRVEGRIESAIAARTTTAITLVLHPKSYAAIQGVVLDMVRFKIASRRPPVADDWKLASDQAEQWLKDFIEGKVRLPDVPTSVSAAASGSIPTDMTVENWP